MARRKKLEPDETAVEGVAKKPAVQTVDAVHTIKYSAPVTVPAVEPEPDDSEDLAIEDFELDDNAEPKPRPLSPRARLREKLAKLGVTNQALKLRIDRLPNYDLNGQSGINAEKDYIRTTACTEQFFDSDDYLEHIRSIAGPGTYWLTLRGGKSIVAQWQERIGGAPQSDQPAIEGVTMASPAAVDPSVMMDAFMRQFEKFQKIQAAMLPPWMKQANPNDWQPPAQQPNTTESALLTLLNSEDELMTQAVGKLKKLFRGDGAAVEDKGPWDAIVAALTSPTLPQTIGMLVSQFRAPQQQPMTEAPPVPQQPPPDVLLYNQLLSILTETMKLNGDALPVLRAMDGFTTFFPQHQLQVENILNTDTPQLLAMLPQFFQPAAEVVSLPHAAEWLDKLKLAYFGEPEAEGSKQ